MTLIITVVGDEFQPAALTAYQVLRALRRSGVSVDDFMVRTATWIPPDGFASASERAERGEDVDHLSPELLVGLQDASVLITHFFPVRATALGAAPQLKMIATLRHGTENIDLDEAARRSIRVINNPGREAEAVSEFAVALILDVLRRISFAARTLRIEGWAAAVSTAEKARPVAGSTIGLVGFGTVGRLVARKLASLGCRILVHDPFVPWGARDQAEHVPLPELLEKSDVVSLHVRLSNQTRNLIGAKELARMRPDAHVVNTARADLVNRAALVDALERRSILGAAFDVLWSEPTGPDDGLLLLPNFLVTPHIAGSTIDSPRVSAELLADRLAEALVTPTKGSTA